MKIPTACTKLWAHLLMWLAMLLIPRGARAQTQQTYEGYEFQPSPRFRGLV
jgi:hypothetical protein